MRRLTIAAAFIVASVGLLASFGGVAAADTISPNPITFEVSQGYNLGDINNQQGWLKSGAYDASVASSAAITSLGFGTQALRVSDAVTSGSFGDQTFSQGLTQPAGESPAQTHFEASFKIGTASADLQTGLHMSVSPDDGSGGRMSYLRFEDQSDGVHVFFDDATDTTFGAVANFSDIDIATLSRTSAHTVKFDIGFTSSAPDVVNIYIDGVLKHTGTTWEDYYRNDPEQVGNGNVVPSTSKLLFREGGDAHAADPNRAFLVDGVSLSSSTSAVCTPTGFTKDGIDMTAAQIGGSAGGDINATGCNIGVYYNAAHPGSVTGANIHGANYYGVLVNGANVNVTNSSIHNIGEVPFNGAQHGNAVVYLGGGGTVSGNTVFKYQKNGITARDNSSVSVLNNTVTGEGPISYIAQNGIQISFGATGSVKGNSVSGNYYTPTDVTACGLLFFEAGGVKQSANVFSGNETNICNAGRGGGKTSA